MQITQSKLGKLPKWAQAYITEQDRLIEYWRSQVKQLGDDSAATGIAWGRVSPKGQWEWTALPSSTVVRFGGEDNYADARYADGTLKINTAQTIAIVPQAANSIEIIDVPYNWHDKEQS